MISASRIFQMELRWNPNLIHVEAVWTPSRYSFEVATHVQELPPEVHTVLCNASQLSTPASPMIRIHYWLVVSTPLKNISQIGSSSQLLGKIKNVPNHQPDYDTSLSLFIILYPHQNCPFIYIYFSLMQVDAANSCAMLCPSDGIYSELHRSCTVSMSWRRT